MEIALTVALVGLLVFLSHLFSGIFSRTKVPDALLLIIVGLFLGPFLGIVTPTQFGAVGPVFTTITLVVILFEGSIGLDFRVLRRALHGTLKLTIVNFLVTMFGVGFFVWGLTELDPWKAFMLGAILGGASPVIVLPLIRQLPLQRESQTILFLESAVADVLSIVVALSFLEALEFGEFSPGLVVGRMISSLLLATFLGIVGALGWSILLNKVRTLQNSIFTTPASVFILFGIVEWLGYSGAIAAVAFGATLGNIELFDLSFLKRYIPHEPIALNDTEKTFYSEVVFLLRTFFFVYIGLSIQLTNLWWGSLGLILTAAIFILRIPVVRFSIPRFTPIADASFIAVIIPKGLAAAVLASIPLQQGIAGGALIQNVTYAVVLFSITLTSLFIFLLTKTKLSKFFWKIFSGLARPPQPREGNSSTVIR